MSTALIIIDIQNDYFPGGRMELVGSEIAAAGAARLLKVFRQQGWPVFHIQHISSRPGASFFLPETGGVMIHTSVEPREGETVITKHFPNSFRDTALLEQLQSFRADNLLVCGMMTHMCVDATVRAGFDLGFSCTVAHDACASRDLVFNGETIPAFQAHGAFLAALGAVYAQLMSVDEILENISLTS